MRSRKRWLILPVGCALLVVCAAAALILFARPGDADTFVNAALPLDNRLQIPPLLAPRQENGELVFDLAAQAGTTTFGAGQATTTWGYNGSYLGPTLRARTGDAVRVNVTNRLGETTTLHWHGMHLPAAMDGGPHQPIAPGATWQPHWTIANAASTLWYHPHQLDTTGAQVYRGLAGLFLIDDAVTDALPLPHEYGVDDIPLVVQDREFDAAGQFVYRPHGSNDALPAPAGMIGDTILVNGTRAPYVDVPAKAVRLRLLNGSNGRRYDFGFADDRPFTQIASDGGLLPAPVTRTRLLLAPGERAEILVDLRAASGPLTMMSYAVVDKDNFVLSLAKGTFGKSDEHQQFKILELRPQAGSFAAAPALPATLTTITRLDPAAATQTRRFSLDSQTINNKNMDHARVDVIVKKGDVEIWEVRNESPFYHPFHVHDVQFQVLARNGQAPSAAEAGWKDTVVVNAAETVRLIMRFADYADPHLPYMFHCHILEHEDMGMMGQFVVVDDPSAPVQLQSPLLNTPGTPHTHP